VKPQRFIALLALVTVAWLGRPSCDDPSEPDSIRLATFNIRHYPASETQVAGAFEIIRSLDVTAVAVQEITDPSHFRAEATARLSADWEFVYTNDSERHQIGVLFDSRRLELLETTTHRHTAVRRGAKPTFEARFRDRKTNAPELRIFVVHLSSGTKNEATRRRQLAGLATLLDSVSGPFVLLGDFNATSEGDRTRIETLALRSKANWASQDVPCTSYWNRHDGCLGTPLDQIITTAQPTRVEAKGPCEKEGCAARDRCPTFFHDVSDHCPVVVELPIVD